MNDFSTDNLRFGEQIKVRRLELTLSLRDLAEMTDLSATFLTRWNVVRRIHIGFSAEDRQRSGRAPASLAYRLG